MMAKTSTFLSSCFLVLLIAANGLKVETTQDIFLQRNDHGAGAMHMAISSMLDMFGHRGVGDEDASKANLRHDGGQRNASQASSPEDISMTREKPAAPVKKMSPQDPHPKSAVPSSRQQMYFRPVSVTLQCVMVLVVMALLVYTALSISRNFDELSGTFTPSTITQTLTIAARVANIAPMLCMLFVGCRMFVLATTEGLGEPPAWVKLCMKTACAGMFIQFFVVLCLPVFSKKNAEEEAEYDMTEGKMAQFRETHSWHKNKAAEKEAPKGLIEASGEYTEAHPQLSEIEYTSTCMKYVFYGIQNIGIVLLYSSIAGVMIGIITFPVGSTKISAAVLCTVMLTKLYFMVNFYLWLSRLLPESEFQASCKNSALSMSGVVRKFPMFTVLFLAARMRALNLDPPYGMPPFWMQCCFYCITGLSFLEVLGAGLVGFNGVMKKAYYGVYIFSCPQNFFLHWVEHVPAIAALAHLIPIIHGITQMAGPDGLPAPLSTTLMSVIAFTTLYCIIALFQSLVLFGEEAFGNERPMIRDTAVSASISLNIAPLLCVLFVATRMRALQITQQQGSPPGWAQDCMMIALAATFVQALCCLVMPIFIGSAVKVDEDGNPDYDLEPMIGAYAVTVVKYVALMALHGSILMICAAVYLMTPETAHDGGRFLTSRRQFFQGLLALMCIFFVALLLSSAKVIGMAIKMAIESADQALLGVDITIQKCALNLFKGYVHVRKLKVHQPGDEIVYARAPDGKLVGTPTGEKNVWKHDFIAKVHLVLLKINLWRLITSLGKEFELQNLSLEGVYLNIEKPDTNLKAKNSNVEYILNFITALTGATESEDGKDDKKEDPKKKLEEEKKKAEEEKKKAEEKAKAEAEEEEALKIPRKGKKDGPAPEKPGIKVEVHKIAFGDMGVGVTIRGVKFLGEISFAPSIGHIQFDDIHNDVFGGRSDLSGGETVACIVKAVAAKVLNQVSHELPARIMDQVGLGNGMTGLKESLAKSWHRMRGYHEES
jgi:hypothetical protein